MALIDNVWERLSHLNHPRLKRRTMWRLPPLRAITLLRWGTLAATIALVVCGFAYEMRTSLVEAMYFTGLRPRHWPSRRRPDRKQLDRFSEKRPL